MGSFIAGLRALLGIHRIIVDHQPNICYVLVDGIHIFDITEFLPSCQADPQTNIFLYGIQHSMGQEATCESYVDQITTYIRDDIDQVDRYTFTSLKLEYYAKLK